MAKETKFGKVCRPTGQGFGAARKPKGK